jgi:hypothetical protein
LADEREIWFDRMGLSYVPCHLKGVGVLAAGVAVAFAGVFVTHRILQFLGYPELDYLAIVPFLITLFCLMRIARRHSAG